MISVCNSANEQTNNHTRNSDLLGTSVQTSQQYQKNQKITLTLEFCAHLHRFVWLMYVQKAELEKDIEFRGIKNLSGFKGFTSDYKIKINFNLGFDNTDYQTNLL